MEIAIIPRWIMTHLSSDYSKQNDINILLSNSIIILSFLIFKDGLIETLGHIPHFCLFDKVTGIECPVCGTTRAFCELSSGNVSNAYSLNATSLLVAIFFLSQIPLRLISIIDNSKSRMINLISKHLSRGVLTIILLNWFINIFINN